MEPFPDLQDPIPDHIHDSFTSELHRRRKSSGLPGDPRGDTDVSALATLHDRDDTPSSSARYSSASQESKPASNERAVRRSKRKRVKSLFRRWKSFTWRHTWVNPLVICILTVAAYAVNPSESNPVYPALFLSYPQPVKKGLLGPTTMQYGKGSKDFAFVGFYTIFLSFTREFIMQRVLRPLAVMGGIKSRGKQARFMEQAYTAVYFAIFGPFGLYVMSKTDLWFFNTEAMYEGFPHRTHDGIFKAYYLLQASYWAQQMIVLLLMLEKPRKDFKELVAHHIITLSLIALSYMFHFARMGLPVYITHDVSDFFLATSKVLNYLDSVVVIPYFVIFIFAWTYLRHYQNLRILYSILPLASPFPDHIQAQISSVWDTILRPIDPVLVQLTKVWPAAGTFLMRFLHGPWPDSQFQSVGSFVLNWDTQQYKCWISQWITFGLLAALQAVNLFWLFLILRILYRMVRSAGEEVVDDRSEYDSDEEEERRAVIADGKSSVASSPRKVAEKRLSNGKQRHQ